MRTRELFSRSATASCLGSAGDYCDDYDYCIEDVPDWEDYGDKMAMVIMITGLLEFLDRHLWMSRRQRERCSTTTPLKMTRFDLERKKSYNCKM